MDLMTMDHDDHGSESVTAAKSCPMIMVVSIILKPYPIALTAAAAFYGNNNYGGWAYIYPSAFQFICCRCN